MVLGLPGVPEIDHVFHSLECPGPQEVCVSRGQETEARNSKKPALPWEHLLISVKPKHWFNWHQKRRQDFGPEDTWEWAGEHQRKPLQSSPQWQGEPGQSHPLAKKSAKKVHRKCVYLRWGYISQGLFSLESGVKTYTYLPWSRTCQALKLKFLSSKRYYKKWNGKPQTGKSFNSWGIGTQNTQSVSYLLTRGTSHPKASDRGYLWRGFGRLEWGLMEGSLGASVLFVMVSS